MNNEKLINVLRETIMSNDIDRGARVDALDLLIELIEKKAPEFLKTVYLAGSPFQMPMEAWNDANEHMKRNQKIQAIKAVRAATGLGLREAKDLVETAGNFASGY